MLTEDKAFILFVSSPPRKIWQLKSPHPREFAIQDKKNAVARGSAGGGGGLGAGGIGSLPSHHIATDENRKIRNRRSCL